MAENPPIASELTAVLLRGHESRDFDYKAASTWDESDKKACCELVKDILAIANTLGGYIAIGVSEQPSGYSFDGFSTTQADSFDTSRLNRFLQKYAAPPINARLRKVTHDGKLFVLIEVPTFSNTPHICQKDFPGTLSAPVLYVRTANNESAPVSSPADFQAVIERAVRNHSDELLKSFRSILASGSAPAEPSAREHFLGQRDQAIVRFEQINPLKGQEPMLGYMEVSFLPERFDASRFALQDLRAAAERAHVTCTGWPFLYIHSNTPERTCATQDGWETFVHTKDFGNDDLMDFWQFRQSGLFYHRTTLRPSLAERNRTPVPVADLKSLAIYIAQAIDCLISLYDGMSDDSEYIALLARILNTENRVLVNSWRGMPLWDAYSCRIPVIIIERRLPLAEWRAAVIDHAVAITNEIYLCFNWSQPNTELARNAIQRMFARQL
jgi:hypothetical protein